MNIDITDQTGKGNKDIVEIYGKDAFEIMEHTLTVKIPYNKLAMDLDNVPHDVPQGDLDIIVELIKKNPNVTREDMARAINKTTKTVQRIINKCEFIKYVGFGDKGH
jgi:predicted HTH transcriptional regulator